MKIAMHSRRPVVVLLMFVGLVSFSCRRAAAPPPPPPAAVAPPPAPAPTITLTATPESIQQGGSTTLQWQTQNASSVRIEPGIGEVAANATRSVNPASSVTYTATATGPGGTATDTVRITVNTPAAPPPVTAAPTPTIEELFRTTVQSIYFDYDQAGIRADQVATLQANARFFQANPSVQFTVSGHADERGSQEYNLGLGDRRANAIRQFLVAQGIADSRINTVSFGEERPVCQDANEACWSRNRRGEFAMR